MKTLVVGDSFVYNRIPTYALFLKKIEPDVTIKGLIGGGNDIISYQLLCEFEKYDRFIINWTSTCRYDVLVSDETKKKFFERNSNHHVVNESYQEDGEDFGIGKVEKNYLTACTNIIST